MKEVVAKFDIKDLWPIGLAFVVTGIGLAYGLEVMGDIRDDMTTNSSEYNATENAISGVAKIPEKLPTLGVVVVAAVIIGVLVRYFAFR